MTKKSMLILGIFSVLLLASFAQAAEVCVVVDFSSEGDVSDEHRFSECFDNINSGDTAESVLAKTGLNIQYANYSTVVGKFICSIDNVGGTINSSNQCISSGVWSFFIANNGPWSLAAEGVSSYRVKNNDVLGFNFDEDPKDFTIPKPVMLRFSEIEVEVDGDEDSSADENGGTIDKDVRPGSKLSFKIELENLYEKDTDIDLEDVELDWEISDIDDNDEIDGDEEVDDIDAGDDTTINLDIVIPLEVEEEDFEMFIEVTAKDTKGISHTIRVEFMIDVEKEDNQVIITNVALNPQTVDCSRNSELRFTVMNIGQDKEDDVEVLVTNNALGISFSDTFDLDEEPFDDDNLERITVPFNVADKVKAGSYPINIQVKFDDSKDEVSKTETLMVKDCGEAVEQPKVEEKKPEVVVVQPPKTTTPTGGAVATKIVPQSTQKQDSWQYGLLALEILAIIVVIVVIIAILAKRRKGEE